MTYDDIDRQWEREVRRLKNELERLRQVLREIEQDSVDDWARHIASKALGNDIWSP